MNIFNNIYRILKNIINSKIFLYCIIGGLIYFWIVDRKELRQNVNRLENNQTALVKEYSRQIEISSNTYKQIFHKEDSIAKLIGIRSNQVQQTIVNNYHYAKKDSVIIKIPYTNDSIVEENIPFKSNIGCIGIEGIFGNSMITFNKVEFNDKLHTFLYKVNNKKISFRNKDKVGFDHSFLFIKWNNHIDAKTYSECKQDTIKVEKNIKIIDN